jgi:hypothetical protein
LEEAVDEEEDEEVLESPNLILNKKWPETLHSSPETITSQK